MKLIGRDKELILLQALVQKNMNVLVEGPVGVGKTALILEGLKTLKKKFIRVDGDARFTEEKLVGWFDPSKIMKSGYKESNFILGPLAEAMTSGSILFINELNRMPEGVQNLLLPALDEGKIQLTQLGEIKAKKGFAIVATQNPSEFVATSDLSEALKDRFEHLGLAGLTFEKVLEVANLHVPGMTKETISLLKDYMTFTQNNSKVINGASLRIILALAKVHSSLADMGIPTKELARESMSIALKNRLNFAQDYSFANFLEDFEKKKSQIK